MKKSARMWLGSLTATLTLGAIVAMILVPVGCDYAAQYKPEWMTKDAIISSGLTLWVTLIAAVVYGVIVTVQLWFFEK